VKGTVGEDDSESDGKEQTDLQWNRSEKSEVSGLEISLKHLCEKCPSSAEQLAQTNDV